MSLRELLMELNFNFDNDAMMLNFYVENGFFFG